MWIDNDMDVRRVTDLADRVCCWPKFMQIDHFTSGHCHELAFALAKLTGYPIGVLWHPRHWHAEPDAQGNGGVHHAIHVCVTDPEGFVIDILGRQSLDEMRRRMEPFASRPARWEEFVYEHVTMERFVELVEDVGCLADFGMDERDEAVEVIRHHPELRAIVSRIDPSFAPPSEPPSGPPPLPGF